MKSHNLLAMTFICLLGIAVYSNTLHSPFQFDDEFVITDNFSIRNISNIRGIWDFLPTRFMTHLSFAANYLLGQLDTFGYHIFNIITHLCAGIMVWWLTLLTFRTPLMKDAGITGYSRMISLFTGLIFVSHPLQTQGVTYICQRTASLAALFYISSVAFYVKSRLLQYGDKRLAISKFFYLLSFIPLILAMFTKEMTITIPLMILLYEYCFFEKGDRASWRRMAPFLGCMLIVPATMALTKSVNFAQMRLSMEVRPGISPLEYLLTQTRVIATYIRLLFIPINQNLDYDYRISKVLYEPSVLLSLGLIIIILMAALRLSAKYRILSLGIFWFFLALVPESSVIPFKDAIFEHRLYLPMVGFSIFLTSAIYYIFKNKGITSFVTTLCVIIAAYSMLAYNRNAIWKDEIVLWNDVIRKSPGKARPYDNRARAYQLRGDFEQAILDYNRSLKINPSDHIGYNNRGCAYKDNGDPSKAITDFNIAIRIKPDYAAAFYNRGLAYQMAGDPDLAISDFSEAIRIRPDHIGAYNNRGNMYQLQGSIDRAIDDYNKALEIDPRYALVYNNRGHAYQLKGDLDHAISDYDKAVRIYPKYATAYCNRAVLYGQKKEYDKAWADVRMAQALGYKVSPDMIMNLKKASGRDE